MSNFWLAGGYYIDLDEYGQLRIAGPGNHLFCGLTLPKPFYISHVYARQDKLRVRVTFEDRKILLHQPVMGDIRSVRAVTEIPDKSRPTFREMLTIFPQTFAPTEITLTEKPQHAIQFMRRYGNFMYGFKIVLPKGVTSTPVDGEYELKSQHLLYMTIECFFNFPLHRLPVTRIVSNSLLTNYLPKLPRELQNLVQRSEDEIEHLVMYSKTSSYEYGTIFPRDWAESAELGRGDLTQRTVDEMYGQALAFVSREGEGWHENVIGELAYQYETSGKEVVDRGMIDIEPRYMMGLSTLSPRFLSKHENLVALQSVARYIVQQANMYEHISFKQRPVGNWRDSLGAYKFVPNPVIPFDVNAVFYPAALSNIYTHRSLLHIPDEEIVPLLPKWFDRKSDYAFVREDGLTAFALCLYGEPLTKLQVDHTDEAYLMLYGSPKKEETISLAKRLLDPSIFYTLSGPLLVGKNEGYTQQQYHGEVIWPKQSALLVAGLRTQIELARQEKWSMEEQKILRDALLANARSSMKAFVELKSVPELYMDQNGTAVAYDSQPVREGQVSYSQLWSAVGFRRMLRDLIYISNLYDIPVEYYPSES